MRLPPLAGLGTELAGDSLFTQPSALVPADPSPGQARSAATQEPSAAAPPIPVGLGSAAEPGSCSWKDQEGQGCTLILSTD